MGAVEMNVPGLTLDAQGDVHHGLEGPGKFGVIELFVLYRLGQMAAAYTAQLRLLPHHVAAEFTELNHHLAVNSFEKDFYSVYHRKTFSSRNG